MRLCCEKFVLCLLAIVVLSGCHVSKPETTNTVQKRVIASGKIRCGWFDWEPLLKKDVNSGEFSGIAVDLMNEVSSRLGLTYEWAEEVGPSTAVEAIQSKRVDMICIPVVITQPRMRVADFSDPILYSRFSVWTRADSILKDTAVLNDQSSIFVAVDGTTAMAMTKQLFPKAKRLSLTELSPSSDLFLNLTARKADAVFADASNAGLFSRYNPGQIKPLSDKDTDRILPWSFMMPVNQYGFTNMINLVLRDMQLDGTVEKIVKKHRAEDMYLRPATAYQKDGR